MPVPIFVEGAVAAIKTADEIFEHRRQLFGTVKKLRYLIVHGRLVVLVFGSAGTGKTTFANVLTGNTDDVSRRGTYQASVRIDDFHLPGNIVATAMVAPGQKALQQTIWPELYRHLPKGRTGGIVNVVSYGYHAFGALSYKDTDSYSNGMTPEKFVDQYAAERRAAELEAMSELVPRLSDTRQKLWMITLVTKQDLWWDKRVEVQEFYTKGEYNAYIEKIRESKGNQQISS